MATLGNVNQSYHQVMVSGVPTPLTAGKFSDLAPEQIGLFVTNNKFITSATDGSADGDKYVIAQGIQDLAIRGQQFGGGVSNAPRKTKKFKASDLIGWEGEKAKRKHQGQIVALGYDGVDASKTLTALLDHKDLVIHLRLWGNMASKVGGNRTDLPFPLFVDKGCIPSGCDTNTVVAGEAIADSIIKQCESGFLRTGYKITDLVTVSKIKKYAINPVALTGLLQFHKFTTSLCDDGSVAALGLIQAQYTALKVTRIGRLDSISTYEVLTQDGGVQGAYTTTTPATFSLAKRTVANCEVCPAGSTKVESAKAYELKGLASASAPVIAGGVVTFIGSTITEKTYLVVTDDTAVDATVKASANTQGYTSALVSTTRDICNFPATTYSWVVGSTESKAPHNWKITLSDTVCGTDRLAELQANYPGFTVSVDAVGICARTYKITNYSEAIEPGCYPEDYRYKAPSAFEGTEWIDFIVTKITPDCIDPVITTPCVAVGVIFESKVEEVELVNDCTYDLVGYDNQAVFPTQIEVSVFSQDVSSNLCLEPKYPVTKLQSIVVPSGQGRWVMTEENSSLLYEKLVKSNNYILNQRLGFKFNAVDGKFYDRYITKLKDDTEFHGYRLNSYFFEEGQGKQFEALINGFIAKKGLDLEPVYL